tara:strand:- start:5447 stop:6613 length:1167 start_codon:yes stop_codon:yes gene_type:complete
MIYLDNAATTFLDPEINSSLQGYMQDNFANSGAVYEIGLDAKKKIDDATESIRDSLGIPNSHSFVYTSGGTEANNLFIKGFCFPDKKVACLGLEHPSITETLRSFKEFNNEPLFLLNYFKEGKLDYSCSSILKEKKIKLLCLSYVNNELGTIIDPVSLMKHLEQEAPQTRLFLDGVQVIGKIKVDKKMWSSLAGLSLSAHKFHGPKGIGLLIYDSRLVLNPQMHGGKQQSGLRAGTLPVPLILALADSIKLAVTTQKETQIRFQELQNYLLKGLNKLTKPILINSALDDSQSAGIVNFSFPPIEGEVMLHHLEKEKIYVGMGSACSAHSKEPSKILTGIGLTDEQARCSLRVSFSRANTVAELEKFLHAFSNTYEKLLPTFSKKTVYR